jgi:hypothetical protein
MFGNHGFFVPQDVAKRYLEAADALKNVGPVCGITILSPLSPQQIPGLWHL